MRFGFRIEDGILVRCLKDFSGTHCLTVGRTLSMVVLPCLGQWTGPQVNGRFCPLGLTK